jgi:DNA-binding transcriptional ArsR family regulator
VSLAEAVFDALGDATRRQVFGRLRKGPRSVGELALGLGVSRPAVSQHLRVLKQARLVQDRAQGTQRIYSVNPQGIDAVRGWLDDFWGDALDRFKALAEREAESKE